MARGLLRATTLVSGNTLVSRILGFIRDIVIAHFFGATANVDAFVVAFKIPNFMRGLFAEGSFSQAFVPVLSNYRQLKTHEETRHFIDHMSGSLGIVLLGLVVVCVLLSPWFVTIFAPGFGHQSVRFALAAHMLRITFPYILLISLTALGSAILNSYDNFSVPSFTPILLNLSMIFFAVVLAQYFAVPVYALAWGVFVAGILQLAFQIPFLARKNLLPRPRIGFNDPGVRRVLKLMLPALVGVSVMQISLLLDSIFASFLKVGSVSWLYYSSRLMNFPLGVFGVAIATVVLPKLSRHIAAKSHQEYSQTLDWSLRFLLFMGLPCSIGLIVLSGPLLSTLFQTGQFNSYDVLMTQQSLITFSIGIQAFMLVKILAAAFYAQQDIKTPVKIAIIAMISNIILNIILIFPLKHAGLALSTSLAAFINVSLLFRTIIKRKIYQPQTGWKIYLLRLLAANVALIIVLLLLSGNIEQWFVYTRFWRIIHLFGLILLSMVVYFSTLFLVGLRLRHLRLL